MQVLTNVCPINDANQLGLDYRHQAGQLPWKQPICDIHTHLEDVTAARAFFQVADVFGIAKVWSMTRLENLSAIEQAFGDRVRFIAVPDYSNLHKADTFKGDWLRRIEQFADRGVRVCKFWAPPRARDITTALTLDSPHQRAAMKLARAAGMSFMTHVADPDLWFETQYRDRARYGTKMQQYEPLRRALEDFHDVKWIAAHMGGDPEHLSHLQNLLDAHPNLHLDTSATKWMCRELGKQPVAFADFCRRNPGRILFGSDIVATHGNANTNASFDLYASRYWSLRTLLETNWEGAGPIVDPDLTATTSNATEKRVAYFEGATLDPATLGVIYHDAAQRFNAEQV